VDLANPKPCLKMLANSSTNAQTANKYLNQSPEIVVFFVHTAAQNVRLFRKPENVDVVVNLPKKHKQHLNN